LDAPHPFEFRLSGYPCLRVETPEERFARIGMIARWKPVHLGHAAVLRALASRADEVLIGIGSSNRVNVRNPFTAEETRAMLALVLDEASANGTAVDGVIGQGSRPQGRFAPHVTVVDVPDLDDGPRWRVMVVEAFGPLDAFVTANPYVARLLGDDYRVVRPVDLVPLEERVPVDGTLVRREMARGEGWRELVPVAVQQYLVAGGLDRRFRKEFGLETLALDAPPLVR
jgi:nicotinamide-nucleotide adenylyltransferase